MGIKIHNGEKILFIGDSITDCGRRSTARPLGDGYVRLFSDLVVIREPSKRITVVNKGVSGNRITDLKDRWADDVLRQQPDWLSVKIGINDVMSVLRGLPDAVTPELFLKTYDLVLAWTRAAAPTCRILLIDPFYISEDTNPDSTRGQVLDLLPKYISAVHKMSTKYRTRRIETHAMFQRLIRNHEPDMFCPEPVHPNPTGHLAIAEAVYDALSR